MEVVADDNSNVAKLMTLVFDRLENIVGLKEIFFSPTIFSKRFILRVIKRRDCVGKGEGNISIYRCFLPITRRQILDWSKLKQSADDNFKFDENSRKFFK